MKKPLEPLIPLDQLKKVVKSLVAVPKAQIENVKPKRRRVTKKSS